MSGHLKSVAAAGIELPAARPVTVLAIPLARRAAATLR
jgi:hypothetical protein